MGDPAGIGPEVAVAALRKASVRHAADFVAVGDLAVWHEAAQRQGGLPSFAAWQPGEPRTRATIPVVETSALGKRSRIPGRPTRAGGRAAYDAIVTAAKIIASGHANGLVTAPINKANLAAAGCGATGHTELLAELAGGADVRMMMIGPRLRVALVTTHLAIADVPAALDRRGVRDTVVIAATALRLHFGLPSPKIAVAGLNPHAGEAGIYGREEIEVIRPAVREVRRRGIDASGPLAADSAFPLMLRGDFDAVVCMYHDQALAPFKLLHFSDGVNFTAGLPFVRTSPDHGTAFDIAGNGAADPASMVAAIRTAARAVSS